MSKNVRGPAVGVVGGFSHENVAFLEENWDGLGARVECGGHGEGEKAQPLLDTFWRVIKFPKHSG